MAENQILLHMALSCARGETDSHVATICPPGNDAPEWITYRRLRRIEELYERAIEKGWEDFDWKKAHEAGILCREDYTTFKEHLNGLTADEYWTSKGMSVPGKKQCTKTPSP